MSWWQSVWPRKAANFVHRRDEHIVVLGAGVIGLTVALQLSKAGYANVSVVAQHMPSDRDPSYTSPWAGVNIVPTYSKAGSKEARWESTTFKEMLHLSKTDAGAGIWIQTRIAYDVSHSRTPDDLDDWFKDLVLDYTILAKDEVPAYADWGTRFGTIALDPNIYLQWLQAECLRQGVVFRRRTLAHIREAFASGHAEGSSPNVVVNCTGLLANKLGGVEDHTVVPVRGQLVVVANESGGMYSLDGMHDVDEEVGECFYIINRPAGGGTVIGGSGYVSEDTEPDMALAERLMKRAITVCPALVEAGQGIEGLDVVRHQVGFRPQRTGGPRLEIEALATEEGGVCNIVHCYGTGGQGYQFSYGVADQAVSLVHHVLRPDNC